MSNVLHNQGANGSYEFSVGDELRGERATLGKTLLDIQRDLRIKAAYIAAIEDAKPDVFPNPSFIPGYVRSYARYLGLDPEEVFRRFCQESGFVPGAGQPRSPVAATGEKRGEKRGGGFSPAFPLARAPRLPQVPFAAIGSVLVLCGLVVGLGYGGWMVLQSIQRVKFAPVDDLPMAAAEAPALALDGGGDEVAALEEPALTDLASPVAAATLADLYRQQELEVPILVPRDGPIAALDPNLTGLLAMPQPGMDNRDAQLAAAEVPAAMVTPLSMTVGAMGSAPVPGEPQVTAGAARVPLVVVAERAAWVRVYLANGTVLFEKILEKGETYAPPEGSETPLIWAGNSGSVYVKVGDTLRGPLGNGTRAAKDVALDPAALVEKFAVVTDIPEVISQTSEPTAVITPAVAIQ